jgi:lysophospholipase L1-like esterase
VRRRASVLCALVLVLLPGCSSAGDQTTSSTLPPADDAGPPVIFVALGGGETTGLGLPDSLRQAWPQLVFGDALPRQAVHVNVSSPGATVAQALDQQVPAALELGPTLATVWLTSGDARSGTRVAVYERDLERVVRRLQDGGVARVLVAAGPEVPEATASGEAYRAAVTRVVERTGTRLVDLSGLEPELGVAGHRRAADAFIAALAADPP